MFSSALRDRALIWRHLFPPCFFFESLLEVPPNQLFMRIVVYKLADFFLPFRWIHSNCPSNCKGNSFSLFLVPGLALSKLRFSRGLLVLLFFPLKNPGTYGSRFSLICSAFSPFLSRSKPVWPPLLSGSKDARCLFLMMSHTSVFSTCLGNFAFLPQRSPSL